MTASHSKEHDRNAIPNVFGTERWGLGIIPCLSMTRRAEWWAGSVVTLLLTTDLRTIGIQILRKPFSMLPDSGLSSILYFFYYTFNSEIF